MIQSIHDDKFTLIHKISENELFVNFIEFNKLEDLGFNPKGFKIDGGSIFAFLTVLSNEECQELHINIICIDPFNDVTKLAVFKSKKYFEIDHD